MFAVGRDGKTGECSWLLGIEIVIRVGSEIINPNRRVGSNGKDMNSIRMEFKDLRECDGFHERRVGVDIPETGIGEEVVFVGGEA